jgi:hypothetical protein
MTMKMLSLGALIAGLLFLTGNFGAAAAEEPKKDQKTIKTAVSVPQPGGGIKSTRASGAEKVARSRSCSGATPKIKKVTPDEGRTGDRVTITGEYFGEPGCLSGVSFGPGRPAKFTQADDKTVTATVPDGKRGLQMLTVTGFTGEDSKPFLRK